MVQAGLSKKGDTVSKTMVQKRVGVMVQVAEQLPSKSEALSSNPSTSKKKKKSIIGNFTWFNEIHAAHQRQGYLDLTQWPPCIGASRVMYIAQTFWFVEDSGTSFACPKAWLLVNTSSCLFLVPSQNICSVDNTSIGHSLTSKGLAQPENVSS
jgi:hypothetical protein